MNSDSLDSSNTKIRFTRQPPLRWDNPVEARMLEYIERTRGAEMARIMTLPDDEYFQEIGDLMELNWNVPDPDGVPE